MVKKIVKAVIVLEMANVIPPKKFICPAFSYSGNESTSDSK